MALSSQQRWFSGFVVVAILILSFLLCPQNVQAAHETGEFEKTAPQGASYTLIVPKSYDRRKSATLLLWLHGAGDNHRNAARALSSLRCKPDWILVVPDARADGNWQGDEMDRVIDADRNAKWLVEWREYEESFAGTDFHGEVKKAFDDLAVAHTATSEEIVVRAMEADAAGDPGAAIEACLEIRNRCYLAQGEEVTSARELLARYRADEKVSRKFRHFLKGTEDWK